MIVSPICRGLVPVDGLVLLLCTCLFPIFSYECTVFSVWPAQQFSEHVCIAFAKRGSRLSDRCALPIDSPRCGNDLLGSGNRMDAVQQRVILRGPGAKLGWPLDYPDRPGSSAAED